MSKVLRVKRSILNQKDGMNECTLDFLCNLFASQDVYEKTKSVCKFSYKEWSQSRMHALEFAILRHALFPKNPEGVDIVQFLQQTKQGHTFIHSLLADTLRALCIAKRTLSTYFECYVSRLQIRFLEHLIAWKHSWQKDFFRRIWFEPISEGWYRTSSKVGEDWDSYLENLQSDQLCWKSSWLL